MAKNYIVTVTFNDPKKIPEIYPEKKDGKIECSKQKNLLLEVFRRYWKAWDICQVEVIEIEDGFHQILQEEQNAG